MPRDLLSQSVEPGSQATTVPTSQDPVPTSASQPRDLLAAEAPAPRATQAPVEAMPYDTDASTWEKFKNGVTAASLGVDIGLKSLAATGAKAAASVLNPSLQSSIQNEYEKDYKDYSSNPDVKAHPYAAIGGSILGASAIPIPGLGAGGIVSKIARGAATGGILGGLSTAPGQGEDVLNPEGMTIGAATGGLLGGVLGNASQVSKGYAKAVEEAQPVLRTDTGQGLQLGYKGPVFTRDAQDTIFRHLGNTVLDNLPFIGTKGARTAQQDGIRDTLTDLSKALLQKASVTDPKQLTRVIGNQLKQANRVYTDQRNDMFSAVYDKLDSTLGKVEVPESYSNSVKSIVQDYGTVLPTQDKKVLLDSLKVNKVTPSAIKDFKNQIWNTIDNMGITRVSSPQEKQAAEALKSLYRDTKGLIENKIQDNIPLLSEYKAANAFEQTRQEIFNRGLHPQFVKAIEDKSKEGQAVQNFIQFLTAPKTGENTARKYLGLLGNQGQDAMQAKVFNDLLTSHLSDTTGKTVLDLPGFIQGIDKLGNSAKGLIAQDARDSLQGLLKVVGRPNVGSQVEAGAAKGSAVGTATLGTAAYYALTGGALASGGAVLAGVKALSVISAHSPLSNILRKINTATRPEMAEYLVDKASNLMQRMGIISNVQPDGNIAVDIKEDKVKKMLQKVSLNDSTGPVYAPRAGEPVPIPFSAAPTKQA